MRRIGAGDPAAEAELVETFSRGVVYLLRRMTGDPDLADDLHQETFRVVLERLRDSSLKEPEKLAAFIRSTARNLFIGDYRKKSRRDTHGDPERVEREADARPGQLGLVLREERARAVRKTIADLRNDRDRQILFRFYIAEEDKETICAHLGLSSLHFNRVLFRARQRFKQVFERSGEAGSGGSNEIEPKGAGS